MIFTDYIQAKQVSPSQTRFDVFKVAGDYSPLLSRLINKVKFNVGGYSFNYGPYTYGKANSQRKPDSSISRTKHISGVFIPDLEKHLMGYGDVQGTHDAIILLFNPEHTEIEIFVARGYSNEAPHLYQDVKAGHHDLDFENLRNQARDVFKG